MSFGLFLFSFRFFAFAALFAFAAVFLLSSSSSPLHTQWSLRPPLFERLLFLDVNGIVSRQAGHELDGLEWLQLLLIHSAIGENLFYGG